MLFFKVSFYEWKVRAACVYILLRVVKLTEYSCQQSIIPIWIESIIVKSVCNLRLYNKPSTNPPHSARILLGLILQRSSNWQNERSHTSWVTGWSGGKLGNEHDLHTYRICQGTPIWMGQGSIYFVHSDRKNFLLSITRRLKLFIAIFKRYRNFKNVL